MTDRAAVCVGSVSLLEFALLLLERRGRGKGGEGEVQEGRGPEEMGGKERREQPASLTTVQPSRQRSSHHTRVSGAT